MQKTKIQNAGNKGTVCFYRTNIVLKKGLFKFKYNLGLHFSNVRLQVKQPFKNMFLSIKGMIHVWIWIKRDSSTAIIRNEAKKTEGRLIFENLKNLKILAISGKFELGTNIIHAQQVFNLLRHKANDILV